MTNNARKLGAGLFITLDGVTESPEKWSFDHFDEDMLSAMTSRIGAQDAVLLGRTTYQEWAPYWPTATDEPFASFINTTPKYVVSTTLDKVEWGDRDNIKLIKGHPADEIARLKRQPGKTIGVHGSPSLVRSLLHNGLLDELTLMIYPVVAGSGERLFKDGDELKRLKLADSKTTRTGVAILTYQSRERA